MDNYVNCVGGICKLKWAVIGLCLLLASAESFKAAPPVITLDNDNSKQQLQQQHAKQPKRYILRTGEHMKLTCPVEQNTSPIIDWMKNGQTIHMGWDRHKVNEAVLRVKDVVIDDGGVYACKATNGFGSVVVEFHVYVYSNESRTTPNPFEVDRYFRDRGAEADSSDIKPFITDLQNYTVNAGERVTWFCDVYSKEEPKIQWFKKIDDQQESSSYLMRYSKNNTISIGESKYVPVAMDTSMASSSSSSSSSLSSLNQQKSQKQRTGFLYSSKLELESVGEDEQGFYLCAVFTSGYFDYKMGYVRLTGTDELLGSPRRTEPGIPSDQRDDLTYVIIIVLVSMTTLVVVIVLLVVRRLRSNRGPGRTASASTSANNKKGCVRLPQQPQQPIGQPFPQLPNQNQPFLAGQYQPAYPGSPLTSSSLPQNYSASPYPVVGGVAMGMADDVCSNSTLPSNAHLQAASYPYPVPASLHQYQQQQHAMQQQQQANLTAQQLKLFQQQQQQMQKQQMMALYDCGEC